MAAAAGAGAGVELILGGEDEHGSQIEELVALWGRIGGIEFEGQKSMAVRADERDLGEEFIDGFDRLERARGALMAGLAALFAAGRGRPRSTAGSGRRIGGRRAGGVGGVLPKARFQESQTGFEFGHPLLKGTAARTLWIRRAHTPEVRGAAPRFLPRERLHPPFGHAGERAISDWFRDKQATAANQGQSFFDDCGKEPKIEANSLAQDFLRFEGNAQTLRLVTKLQVLGNRPGLNLTWGTLSALSKYIAPSDKCCDDHHERSKPGYFSSESALVEEIRGQTGTGEARNPITYLVEAADDIVYSAVDLEDGIKKRVVDWRTIKRYLWNNCDRQILKQILALARGILGTELSALDRGDRDEAMAQAFRISSVSHMVRSAVPVFADRYADIMCNDYHQELVSDSNNATATVIDACKKAARVYVYPSAETLRLEIMGRRVLHDLMDLFWEAASAHQGNGLKEFPDKIFDLISHNYRQIYQGAVDEGELPKRYCQMQLVTDYVCGMTDTFACTLHRQLTNG